MFTYEFLFLVLLALGVSILGGIVFMKGKVATVFLSFLIGLSLFVFLIFKETENQNTKKEVDIEQRTAHNNLLLLPEGRYILDLIVSTDSSKVRFILQLPGVAKRTVEVIAYDGSPIYWNEWQAESAVPGDTLIIRDVWANDSTGKKYDRTIQKLSPEDIGLGYVTFTWIEREQSIGRDAWSTPPEK